MLSRGGVTVKVPDANSVRFYRFLTNPPAAEPNCLDLWFKGRSQGRARAGCPASCASKGHPCRTKTSLPSRREGAGVLPTTPPRPAVCRAPGRRFPSSAVERLRTCAPRPCSCSTLDTGLMSSLRLLRIARTVRERHCKRELWSLGTSSMGPLTSPSLKVDSGRNSRTRAGRSCTSSGSPSPTPWRWQKWRDLQRRIRRPRWGGAQLRVPRIVPSKFRPPVLPVSTPIRPFFRTGAAHGRRSASGVALGWGCWITASFPGLRIRCLPG